MPWFLTYALVIGLPLFGMYYFNIRQILNAGATLWNWNRVRVRRWFIIASCFVNLLPIVAVLAFWLGGRGATTALSGENRLLDWIVVYPFWFSLVITVQVFLLLVFWKFGRLLARRVLQKGTGARISEPRIVIAISVLALAYSCFTISTNTWGLRVNERDVKLPADFSRLDGLRIVLVADVQGDGRTTPERIRSMVERANSFHPDLLLFGGDVVTSGAAYVESTLGLLGKLQARSGRIAVVGDHDMFSGKRPIVDGLKHAGFSVLEDSSMRLTIRGVRVVVTGLVYTYRQRPTSDMLAAAIDNGDSSYKILLVHQPRESLVEYAAGRGYHLFAAGHTHGGAIAIGIPGLFLVAPSRFETKYFTGFYDVGGMVVSVTNGIGHTLAPIRFQAPAEITVIRLVK